MIEWMYTYLKWASKSRLKQRRETDKNRVKVVMRRKRSLQTIPGLSINCSFILSENVYVNHEKDRQMKPRL